MNDILSYIKNGLKSLVKQNDWDKPKETTQSADAGKEVTLHNDTKVNLREEWSFLEEAARSVVEWVSGFFTETLPNFLAKDVANTEWGLNRLYYNWQQAWDHQKKQYINQLYNYKTISEKIQKEGLTADDLTDEEKEKLKTAIKELPKYKEAEWWLISDIISPWGKLLTTLINPQITLMSMLFWDYAEQSDAKWKSEDELKNVDYKKTLQSLNSGWWAGWRSFWLQAPWDKEEKKIEMTQSQIDDENYRYDHVNKLLESKAKKLQEWEIKLPIGPNRPATADEFMWAIEWVLNSRFWINIDWYAEIAKWFHDLWQYKLEQNYLQAIEDSIDLAAALAIMPKEYSDDQIIKSFVERTGRNPFDFDFKVEDIDWNDDIKNFIIDVASAWWDRYNVGNVILKALKAYKAWGIDVLNPQLAAFTMTPWEQVEAAWRDIEFWWAVASDALSRLTSSVTALIDTWNQGTWTWEDYSRNQKVMQTSSVYNTREDLYGEDFSNRNAWEYWFYKMASTIDEVINFVWWSKKINFEISLPTAKALKGSKVLLKGTKDLPKLKNIIATTKNEVDDVLTWAEKWLKDTEKIRSNAGKVEKTSALWKAKDRVIEWLNGKRDAWVVKNDWKTNGVIFWNNVARWIAEEAISSAYFQWMVPYDYQPSDLAIDVAWAIFSGILRWIEFNNKWGFNWLNTRNHLMVQWYLSEANWISKQNSAKILKSLSPQAVNELWEKIQEMLWWFLWDDLFRWIDQKEFNNLAGQLSKNKQKQIRNLANQLSNMSDQNLLRLAAQSSKQSVRDMTRFNEATDAVTWEKRSRLVWNKPKDMSREAWANEIDKLRQRLYKTWSIDWVTRVKWRTWLIGQVRKYVDNNIEKLLKDPENNKKYKEFVEKDWTWRQPTEDTDKKRIKNELAADLLKQRWINVDRNRFGKNTKTKVLWHTITGLLDENIDSRIKRKFNVWINTIIEAKQWKRIWLLDAIKFAPGGLKDVFMYYVENVTEGKYWDIMDIPLDELEALAKDFWDNMEKYYWQYFATVKWWDAQNITQSKAFMKNKTYTEALEVNPDLKYMGQKEFERIKDEETMTIFEIELVLRSFRHNSTLPRFGNVIVWVNTFEDAEISWSSIANEVDRKMLFWKKWTIYIKHNNKVWAAAIESASKKEDKLINEWISADEWVEGYKYEYTWTSDSWVTHYYLISNERGETMWTLMVSSRWWGSEYIKLERPKSWDGIEKSPSYTIEIQREDSLDPNDAHIGISDEDMATVKEEDIEIKWSEIFWNEEDYATYTLKTWDEVWEKLRRWELTYNEFAKLMPKYAEKVPPEVFNIIKMDVISPTNRMELLLAAIMNPKIMSDDIWYTFDLSGWWVVFTLWHNQSYIYDPKKWKLVYSRSISESDLWEGIIWWSKEKWVVSIFDNLTWREPKIYYYQYDPRRRWYVLYEKPIWSKHNAPAWFVKFQWSERMDIRILDNNGERKKVSWQVTFYKTWVSEDDIRERIDNIRWTWKVETRKELPAWTTYEDVYKMLYWEEAEMPASILYHLKSDQFMTPTVYFYREIDKLKNSPEFVGYRMSWNPNTLARKFRQARKVKALRDAFSKKYPTSTLTEWRKFWISEEIIRRLNKDWEIKLTNVEQEVAEMIYWKDKQLDVYDKMNVIWYTKYWVKPADSSTAVVDRLHDRKDALLVLKWISPELLRSWKLSKKAKKMLFKLYYGKWNKTLIEQLDEIIESWEYFDVFKDFSNQIREALYDMIKDVDMTEEEVKRLDELNKKLDKLEKKWEKKKKRAEKREWKKYVEKDKKDIRVKVEDSMIEAAKDKIKKLKQDLMKYQDEWDLENWGRAEREIAELQESINLSELIKKQKSALSQWEMQEASLKSMAQKRVIWIEERPFVEPMSEQEIEERISMINKSDVRVLKLNPATWVLDLKSLSPEEQALYWDKLREIWVKIASWEINAAHFAPLHAIVIDPKILNEYDLWHEWYHEAVKSMMDQWRRQEVVDSVWWDYKKEIIQNANNRWYSLERYYQQTGKTAEDFEWYKKWITEEWLADRFWEYINGQFVAKKWSVLERFFEDLWQYIRLIFSDKKALDLFEDIYEWKIQYNRSISDEATDAYSLPTRKYSNENWFTIWDDIRRVATDLYSQWFWANEISEILNPKNAWRWYYWTPQFNATFDYLLKAKWVEFSDAIDDYITKDSNWNIADRKVPWVVNTMLMSDIANRLWVVQWWNVATKLSEDWRTMETTTQLGNFPIFLYQKFTPRNIDWWVADMVSDYYAELNICWMPVYNTLESTWEMWSRAHSIQEISDQLMPKISKKLYKSVWDSRLFRIGRNIKEYMVQQLPISRWEWIVLANALWEDVTNYKIWTQANFRDIPWYRYMEDAYRIYYMNTMISHSEITSKRSVDWRKYQLRKFWYKPADMIWWWLSEMTKAMFELKAQKTAELVDAVMHDSSSEVKVFRSPIEKNLIEFVYDDWTLTWKLWWHLWWDEMNILNWLPVTPRDYDKYPYVWWMSPFSLAKNKYKIIIEKWKERAAFELMKTLQTKASDYVSQWANINRISAKIKSEWSIPMKDVNGYKAINWKRIYTDYEKVEQLKKELNDNSIEVKWTVVPDEYSESRAYVPYSEVQSSADDGIIKIEKWAPLTNAYYAILLRKRNNIYNKFWINEKTISKKRATEIYNLRQAQRKEWIERYRERVKEDWIDMYRYKELKAEQQKLLAKQEELNRITDSIAKNPLYIISKHLDESIAKSEKLAKAIKEFIPKDDARQLKEYIHNPKYKIKDTTSKYWPLATRIDRNHIQPWVYNNKVMAEILGRDWTNIINSPSKIIQDDPKFRAKEMEYVNQNREVFAVSDFDPKMYNEIESYDNVILYATDDLTMDAYEKVMKSKWYDVEYTREWDWENIKYFKREQSPEVKQEIEDNANTMVEVNKSINDTISWCPIWWEPSIADFVDYMERTSTIDTTPHKWRRKKTDLERIQEDFERTWVDEYTRNLRRMKKKAATLEDNEKELKWKTYGTRNKNYRDIEKRREKLKTEYEELHDTEWIGTNEANDWYDNNI